MQKIQILHLKGLPESTVVQSSDGELVTKKKICSCQYFNQALLTQNISMHMYENSEQLFFSPHMAPLHMSLTNMECDWEASFMEKQHQTDHSVY